MVHFQMYPPPHTHTHTNICIRPHTHTHTHTHTVTGGSAAQFEPLSDEYEWAWEQYLGYRVGA